MFWIRRVPSPKVSASPLVRTVPALVPKQDHRWSSWRRMARSTGPLPRRHPRVGKTTNYFHLPDRESPPREQFSNAAVRVPWWWKRSRRRLMANDRCSSRLSVSLISLAGKTAQHVTTLRNLICAVLVILSGLNVAAQQITEVL